MFAQGQSPEGDTQEMADEFVGMLPLSRPRVSDTDLGNILEENGLKTLYPECRSWRDETQRDCFVRSVRGDSLIVQLPTGYGKSIIAILPAVVCGGLTVIVSPTISLIDAMHSDCMRRQIHAFKLTCSSSYDEQKLAIEAVLFLQGGILIVTPEKASSPSFQSLLSRMQVTRIVFDEAHCITCWGGWRPAYKFVSKWLIPILRRGVPVTFLSATLSSYFYKRVPEITGYALTHFSTFFKSLVRPNLTLNVERAPSKKEFSYRLRELLGELDENYCAIVYCRSIRMASEVSKVYNELFASSGDPITAPYHSQLTSEERSGVLSSWQMRNKPRVIVGTEALGVGIDHPRVGLVVHFGIPATVTSYMQHIGRAGRQREKNAVCVMMYSLMQDIEGWLLTNSLQKTSSIYTLPGGTQRTENPQASVYDISENDAGGVGVTPWSDVVLIDQSTEHMKMAGRELSEMALLCLRAEKGGCVPKLASAHLTPAQSRNCESVCGKCSGCVLQRKAPRFDAKLAAVAAVKIVSLFSTEGICLKMLHHCLIRSKSAGYREEIKESALKIGVSPEVLDSSIHDVLDEVFPEQRKCRISVPDSTLLAHLLVAEEGILAWKCRKSARHYKVDAKLIVNPDGGSLSRVIYIGPEGPI